MFKAIQSSPLQQKLEQELHTSLVTEGDVYPGSLAPVIARNKNLFYLHIFGQVHCIHQFLYLDHNN